MDIVNLARLDLSVRINPDATEPIANEIAPPVLLPSRLMIADENSQPDIVPATRVTIGRLDEPSPVYAAPEVIATYIRDTAYTGPAAVATSQAMVQTVNQFKNAKATLSVSNLFSRVGALSGETAEYRNEARQFRVPGKIAIDKFSPDFLASRGKPLESVTLSVTTKEGDVVEIKLSRNQVHKDASALTFSFVVDGELSQKEQQALAQLADKLGAIGDEFFRMDTAELRGLKNIDAGVISHFGFALQRPDPIKGGYVEHSYEFSVDEQAQTQTLRATDVRGYSVEITTQLHRLMDGKGAEAAMLEPYVELIRHATDDADVDNKSRRFILDAFESMFAPFTANPETGAAENINEASLRAFNSGLPDFNANITSEVKHNQNFYAQTAALSLTLEQQTQIETLGNSLLIKQESRYELINNRFEPLVGLMERADLDSGDYRYVTEHLEGSTNRIMSLTGDRVNNLLVEQTVNREKEAQAFRNYQFVDKQSDDADDRKLQQFNEVLNSLNANKQYVAINELLDMSKENLFLH